MTTTRNHIGQQDEGQRKQHANHMAAGIMNGYSYGDCAPGQEEPGLRVIPCHVEKVTPLTTDYKGAVLISHLEDKIARRFQFTDPLHHSLRATIDRNVTVIPPIILLFFPRRPIAILFSIVAIGVAAFKSMLFGRTVSHIGVPSFEFFPFRGVSNPATTVIGIFGARWKFASLLHSAMNAIQGMVFHPMGLGKFSSADNFFIEAAAGLRAASYQGGAK